jgi:hypothetical protein
MQEYYCPNYSSCKLVHTKGFVTNNNTFANYLESYCKKTDNSWENCKRYITKSTINFCPDFVMPDTVLSTDEIIDKYEELEN